MSAQRVLDAARAWLGTPYHHAARMRGAGVDCGQLLAAVFCDDTGLVPAPVIEGYPADWMMHRSAELFLAHVERHAQAVQGAPAPADIVLFRRGRCYSHAAIVEAWPTVIHADAVAGCVTRSNALQGRLAGREYKIFRVVGVGE